MDEKNLDEAIDRTVRDMTYVAADDDAVARVMARVREADTRAAGGRWMFALTPRAAWAGAAALLLIAIVTGYSLRSLNQQQPPQTLAAREFPTRVVPTPSITQATTARITRRDDTVRPASVANDAADASNRARDARNAQPELAPFESDLEIASITPAPLGDAPSIEVAPLVTSSLTVDEIPVSSIDMPAVSPEQQR
jgi:hypothetical protein